MESIEALTSMHGLYLILTAPRIPHVELAAAACERRVPVIQLREKHLEDEELTSLARDIADITRRAGTLLIINDRPDIAAAVGADGVHLGREDADIVTARGLLDPSAVIGLSTRTPEEAAAAVARGADYIGVGPVFPTGTKPDARAPIGLDGLRAVVAREPDITKVAIGGITSDTAGDVIEAGARYVAVISAVCHADDPVRAIDEFQARMRGGSPPLAGDTRTG